ncbi:MAG: P-loop ATPase, Sll1717 family [Chthoniobacteraceae bacterium]
MSHQLHPTQRTPSKSLLSAVDFGNEAGDDLTPIELLPFFVEQATFQKYLDPNQRILLATAKKGVGKSALLRWIEAKMNADPSSKPLVIYAKGSDLVRGCFNLSNELKSPNDYIRDWMIRIATLVNRRLGSSLNIAFDDDSMSMVEAAEIEGFRSKNLLSALTDRLPNLLNKRIQSKKTTPKNDVELLRRFEGQTVWFLVDDLDATYQRTPQENLELSTFFSACRQLVSQTKGVVFRITMRTDVWPLIRRFDEALDKFEQYTHDIAWSQADFRKVLYKRILHQATTKNMPDSPAPQTASSEEVEEHMINRIFEKRMPWGDTERRTYKVVYTLSYHRPRWAIQLCKLGQKAALQDGSELIAKRHIDEVWGTYGNKRIADLIAEHKHQCSEVEELLVGFRGAERRMTREKLLAWVTNRIKNHMTPIIEGKPASTPLEIAHFLFRIGFIVARAEEGEDYEHYYYSDMPDFLSMRTNQDFGVIWEIHPCYREALDIKKLGKYQQKRRNLAR